MTPEPLELSSCVVSDAMTALGLANGVITGISPMGGQRVLAGPAFPVRFVAATDGGFNDYLEQVPLGHIIFIDAVGRTDVSAWGGLIALEAQRLGIAGALIHGACRDVAEFDESGFGVFARASTPQSGRHHIVSMNAGERITVDGVGVDLGDLVVADVDGIAVVPGNAADDVAEMALSIDERDRLIADKVRGGLSLAAARQLHRRG